MKSLEKLNIEHNRITSLEPGMFRELNHLNELEIDGNPFLCDCDLKPFTNFISGRFSLKEMPKASCASPQQRQSMNIIEGVSLADCEEQVVPLVQALQDAFRRKPSDVTVPFGAPVFFPCAADHQITWSKDGIDIEASDRVKITSVGLEIPNVVFDDSGVYECSVRTSEGKLTASGTLKVLSWPVLLSDNNQKLEKYLGGVIVITCKFVSNPRATVTWLKDGQRLKRSKRVRITGSVNRYTVESTLKIYRAGDTVEIPCDVFGDPFPSMWLSKDQQKIISGGRYSVIDKKLIIFEAREEDAGLYICNGRNYAGLQSKPIEVIFKRSTSTNRIAERIHDFGLMGGPEIEQIVVTAAANVRKAVNQTIARLKKDSSTPEVPVRTLFALAKFPSRPGLKKAVAAEIFEETVRLALDNLEPEKFDPDAEIKKVANHLTEQDINDLRELAGCDEHQLVPNCEENMCFHKKYRTVDGLLVDSFSRREQINSITSFIDASNVYGSDLEKANYLRMDNDPLGRLKTRTEEYPKGMLPFSGPANAASVEMDCRGIIEHVPSEEARTACFMAGDARANEQIGLTTMHTIFLREHNRIAWRLHEINPHWSGEEKYLESRKIIGAIMQKVTYSEWLPKILGEEGMKKLGNYTGYNPTENPSVTNVFATAAFRFGHSLIKPVVKRLDENLQPHRQYGDLPLYKAFFNPYQLFKRGGIDPIIRGLVFTGSKDKRMELNGPMNPQLIERLFESSDRVALDLGALNIQRGRDHALPFYAEWREHCGLAPLSDWNDLRNEFDTDVIDKFKLLYSNVEYIELFPALVLEKTIPGTRTGPTLQCLLVDQFKKLRSGDRFWYQRPGEFSPQQLREIEKTTLGRIFCENGDAISKMSTNVFLMSSSQVPCEHLLEHSSLDLEKWTDTCEHKITVQ
ncbi:Oidioi.mRNA.OKI2018_I69.chr1.g3234.t1.cds [Oikopleura dioica]|uniref:Oidioi.mRNA.OKI2018_I69.chr1.g3234.t1.cds n=1 Tax=Oikopleura dioica TaxID=34765 RepID=A0ABN7STI8_OIKDI|nr:Oidioi.mRNA.OKI2018_I69.chr1.g3234.t1.cds [Oikopleura dioica]